jgi:hypothetical protein
MLAPAARSFGARPFTASRRPAVRCAAVGGSVRQSAAAAVAAAALLLQGAAAGPAAA